VTLLLNRELVSRVNLCPVCVFHDMVKDCPKMRNFPKIFLRSFENVAPDVVYCVAKQQTGCTGVLSSICSHTFSPWGI